MGTYLGLLVIWENSYSEAKTVIASESNCRPLSDLRTSGIPCRANIPFRALTILGEVVDVNFTSSGYLDGTLYSYYVT